MELAGKAESCVDVKLPPIQGVLNRLYATESLKTTREVHVFWDAIASFYNGLPRNTGFSSYIGISV